MVSVILAVSKSNVFGGQPQEKRAKEWVWFGWENTLFFHCLLLMS